MGNESRKVGSRLEHRSDRQSHVGAVSVRLKNPQSRQMTGSESKDVKARVRKRKANPHGLIPNPQPLTPNT
jgi:hypothetical protein